jgi:hypothetical protein
VVATLLLLNQSADPPREAVPARVGSASKTLAAGCYLNK